MVKGFLFGFSGRLGVGDTMAALQHPKDASGWTPLHWAVLHAAWLRDRDHSGFHGFRLSGVTGFEVVKEAHARRLGSFVTGSRPFFETF